MAPAPSESSSSLKWVDEAAHFRCSVSSFCLLLPGAARGGAGRQSAGWLWWGLYWEACDVGFSDLLSWLDGGCNGGAEASKAPVRSHTLCSLIVQGQ